ncbi:restriction endonuclease [Streptomyces decoyicus]
MSETLLAPIRQQLAIDRGSVNKFKLVRTVLVQLNEQGDRGLGVRRALLKRVTEFEDFSTLWPEDQHKASGLIAEIRRVVNVKDSFTRLHQERDAERAERLAHRRQQEERVIQRRERFRDLRSQLSSLTSVSDPHARGLSLERILNQIFEVDGLLIRESFALRNEDGQTSEQIDGVIELSGTQYIVEVKWWGKPLGIDPVCRQLVRVYGRAEARGLFISASGFTDPAIEECERALAQRVIILGELRELLLLLEQEGDLTSWVREKARLAVVERRPLALLGTDFHMQPTDG